jgi:L-rhamnose mutarotase
MKTGVYREYREHNRTVWSKYKSLFYIEGVTSYHIRIYNEADLMHCGLLYTSKVTYFRSIFATHASQSDQVPLYCRPYVSSGNCKDKMHSLGT